MSENLSVLRLRGGRLEWLQAGAGAAECLEDAEVAARLAARLRQRGNAVVFAAPGADIRLQSLAVTREERRHIAASLPYMLEESVAEDIEALHFARQDLSGDRIAVAAVRSDRMRAWQAALAGWPALSAWTPAPLLLPRSDGEWSLVCEEQEVLLRYGESEGAALEPALAPALLSALAAESIPQTVVVYGDDETRDLALLPDDLRERAQWRRGGFAAALLLADPGAPRLDLRQGAFAPRLPLERWWGQWRVAAVLLAAAVGVHLLGGWLDLRRLEADNLALRGEIQQIYREVNPRGAVVDAEKQLRRQLDALGGGESPGFSELLAPLGELMAEQGNAVFASLNYSGTSGELRVNMLAEDFDAVERIRAGLVDAGLAATLESSSRAGEGVRARLRIERGAS